MSSLGSGCISSSISSVSCRCIVSSEPLLRCILFLLLLLSLSRRAPSSSISGVAAGVSITGSSLKVDTVCTDSLTLFCRVRLDGGDIRPSSRTGLRLLLLRLDPVVLMLAALSALLGLPRLSSLSRSACLCGRPDIYALNSSASLPL